MPVVRAQRASMHIQDKNRTRAPLADEPFDLPLRRLNAAMPQPRHKRHWVDALNAHWEHFEHGADIGVRGFAATKAGAFEQAALALTAVVTEPSRVHARTTVAIDCEAPDDELLLARWLNALVSEMALRRMLFGRFEVRIDGRHLCARAHGETTSLERHEPAVEVKGATCTALRVAPVGGGWLAQTVVDV